MSIYVRGIRSIFFEERNIRIGNSRTRFYRTLTVLFQKILFIDDEGGTVAKANETIKINASYVDVGDFKINTVVIWRLVGCSRRSCFAGRWSMAAINNATPLGAILSSRDTLRNRRILPSLPLSFAVALGPLPYPEAPQCHFRYTTRRGIHRSVSAATLDP